MNSNCSHRPPPPPSPQANPEKMLLIGQTLATLGKSFNKFLGHRPNLGSFLPFIPSVSDMTIFLQSKLNSNISIPSMPSMREHSRIFLRAVGILQCSLRVIFFGHPSLSSINREKPIRLAQILLDQLSLGRLRQ